MSVVALGAALLAAAPGLAGTAGAGPAPAAPPSSWDRSDDGFDRRAADREVRELVRTRDRETDRRTRPGRFDRDLNVFLPDLIAVEDLADTTGGARATVPLYEGFGPRGERVQYIVTEAADRRLADRFGVIHAPRLANADPDGVQDVTVRRGKLAFEGTVDFAPERVLRAGPAGFPPEFAQPGAVADARYSSVIRTPAGAVYNIAIVANATGTHDRLVSIDRRAGTVTLQLLDGFQGGQPGEPRSTDRFYYHFVTDSSDPVAATIELGTYAPKLAELIDDEPYRIDSDSALLGFSPNANGETGVGNPDRQGLNSTVLDGDLDPINVFPLDPPLARGPQPRGEAYDADLYSPLWLAHVSQWTEEAIAAGERRRIRGLDDLRDLVVRGLVTSFEGSTGAPSPDFAGLRSTGIIINCPVILQPEQPDPDLEGVPTGR